MKSYSVIPLFGVLVALLLTSCKQPDSNSASQWEYKIVQWSDFYRPLMKQIQNEGKAKYFTTDKDTDYVIDFGGALALQQRTPEYLYSQLNNYGKDGWEFTGTIGEQTAVIYIFKKKR